MENHIIALFESNDKQWLARRSRIYQNLHEIKNLINSNYFPQEFTEEIDKYIEVNEMVDRSIEPVKLLTLKKYLEEYIVDYENEITRTVPIKAIRDEMKSEFSFGCKIRIIDTEKQIQCYKMNLIKIMYKNLLDNYRKWGDIERDSVLIHQRKNSNQLEFIVKSSTLFDEKNIKKLLVEPYTTTTNRKNKAHYGMFIIGMIARHLGGYAYVTNNKKNSVSQLIIQIPIK